MLPRKGWVITCSAVRIPKSQDPFEITGTQRLDSTPYGCGASQKDQRSHPERGSPQQGIKPHEQIGQDRGGLPEHKEQQQIIGRDNPEHGDHESMQVDKKAVEVLFPGHVAGSVKADKKTGHGNDQAE